MAPLGIDPLKTPTESCSGIGGIAVAHYSAVAVEIPGFQTLMLYAGFTDGLENAGVGLLGHAGFFNRFKVTFDVRNGVFELEDPASEESGR